MYLRYEFILLAVVALAPRCAAAECHESARSPELARCFHLRGYELFEHGEFKAAAVDFQHAARAWAKLGDRFRPALARTLDMLGESHAAQEQWVEAERAYRGAIAAAGPATLDGAAAQSRLAYVLVREGRMEEARKLGEEALPLLSSGTLERPMLMHILASAEPANARRWLSEAVSAIIEHGKPHPALARILEDYADILIADGNASRALPLLRRAEAMYSGDDTRKLRLRRLVAELEAPDRQRHEVSFGLISK